MGDSPPPPDPYATAQAQNMVNSEAIKTAAQYNQINQQSPFGSISYSGDLGSPNRTQTTSLDPALQKLLTGQEGISQTLTDAAQARLGGLAQMPQWQQPNNPNGYNPTDANLATQFNPGGQQTTGNVNAKPLQYGFNQGQGVQGQLNFGNAPSLNTDFSGQAKQAQDANYAQQTQYLDPQFAQSDQQLQTRLAAQGVTQGSDAYNQAMNNAALQKQSAYSDARNSAIGAGNQEQNTLFGQNLSARQQGVGEATTQGNFANASAAQQFAQNQGQAGFYNATQAQNFNQGMQNAQLGNSLQDQQFGQNLAEGQFGNQAQQQMFSDAQSANQQNQNIYQQMLSNQLQGRQENFNEASAFLNGSPVSPAQPTFQPINPTTAAQASPDMIGLAGSNYRAATQASGGLLGSIFGAAGQLGSAAIAACWVAREVYGPENPEWLAFREWLMVDAPKWLKKLYIRFGERIADWIKDKPALKNLIHAWMNARINACA